MPLGIASIVRDSLPALQRNFHRIPAVNHWHNSRFLACLNQSTWPKIRSTSLLSLSAQQGESMNCHRPSRVLKMGVLSALAGCSMLALSASELHAQRAAPGASTPAAVGTTSSAEERAAQLRAVVGLVTTPDRELNIANFEKIVESGDARQIELAVRAMIASDDPAVRSIAMRGYIAAARTLVLEVVLAQDELKVLETARAQPNGLSNLRSPNVHLRRLGERQFRFTFEFRETPLRSMTGRVNLPGYANSSSQSVNALYTVRGERLTFRISPVDGWNECDFELRGTRDANIEGTMACQHQDFQRPVQLIAPMF